VQGIKNLRELDQYILTNTVITSANYKDLPQLAELFVKLGVNHFQFAFVHIKGRAEENKDWLVPRKTEVVPYAQEGLDIGLAAGIRVFTEAIPFCLMRGYEQCVAEQEIPETSIFDVDFKIDDYSAYRKNSGKAKREECKKCKYNKICEGPWKEYVDIFGWDEFQPVRE
ncbi:MAG TPA: hypothetical protein VKO42_03115, partial [Patescibacteria group bacterium]|nr:hypothetical protein [Patescibacteria group bacterium]